jgi:hypothetical protein
MQLRKYAPEDDSLRGPNMQGEVTRKNKLTSYLLIVALYGTDAM